MEARVRISPLLNLRIILFEALTGVRYKVQT
jgi:hypothetical protein